MKILLIRERRENVLLPSWRIDKTCAIKFSALACSSIVLRFVKLNVSFIESVKLYYMRQSSFFVQFLLLRLVEVWDRRKECKSKVKNQSKFCKRSFKVSIFGGHLIYIANMNLQIIFLKLEKIIDHQLIWIWWLCEELMF